VGPVEAIGDSHLFFRSCFFASLGAPTGNGLTRRPRSFSTLLRRRPLPNGRPARLQAEAFDKSRVVFLHQLRRPPFARPQSTPFSPVKQAVRCLPSAESWKKNR